MSPEKSPVFGHKELTEAYREFATGVIEELRKSPHQFRVHEQGDFCPVHRIRVPPSEAHIEVGERQCTKFLDLAPVSDKI